MKAVRRTKHLAFPTTEKSGALAIKRAIGGRHDKLATFEIDAKSLYVEQEF